MPEFYLEEAIQCLHRGKIYHAIIKRILLNKITKKPDYFVHYPGWNHTYDEWVDMSRVSKMPISKRGKVEIAIEEEDITEEETNDPINPSISKSTKGRFNELMIEKYNNPMFDIWPVDLKISLIEDAEFIFSMRLFNLPREFTVKDVINRYKKQPSTNTILRDEFCTGLLGFFNQSLPYTLLYDVERLQYEKFIEEYNGEWDLCYGPEHLLRLCCKLPLLLDNSIMSSNNKIEQIKLLTSALNDFLIWFNEDKTKNNELYHVLYMPMSTQYIKRLEQTGSLP